MRWLWLLAGLGGLAALAPQVALGEDRGVVQTALWMPEPAPASYGLPTIPLEMMAPDLRARVASVLDNPTLTARGLPETFNTRPEIYHYLLDHPDQAVKLWRKLGARVSDINDQGGGRYLWQDGQGSEVHWLSGLHHGGLHLWYAEGKVKPGLFLPAQNFRAVAVLKYTEGTDTRGLPAIRHQVHFILRCESRAVALAARIMGASAPRLAEQYLGQLQAFYGGMAWYLYQDGERGRLLFVKAGLPVPAVLAP
jgi:hypothetical protein